MVIRSLDSDNDALFYLLVTVIQRTLTLHDDDIIMPADSFNDEHFNTLSPVHIECFLLV